MTPGEIKFVLSEFLFKYNDIEMIDAFYKVPFEYRQSLLDNASKEQ